MTLDALPRTSRTTGLLLAGFGLAVLLRSAVGGVGVAQSASAGLLFAVLLVALSAAARTVVPVTPSALAVGCAGAVVLCLPVVLWGAGSHTGTHGFARWAAVVAVVAVAEEVFLRGTLYEAVQRTAGDNVAIAAGAVGFALLHVPLYGWSVVPLDLAVGVLLGELRRTSGTPAAPAVAHLGADMAGWFLR